jgi:hypothetical protein
VVTTVPRALAAAALAAVLTLFGVPLSPAAAPPPAPDRPTFAIALPGPGPHAAAHPRRGGGVTALALAAWGGDHRPLVLRDLDDGRTPLGALLPDIGGPWALAPLPRSAAAPETAAALRLPPGRAPPSTTRV